MMYKEQSPEVLFTIFVIAIYCTLVYVFHRLNGRKTKLNANRFLQSSPPKQTRAAIDRGGGGRGGFGGGGKLRNMHFFFFWGGGKSLSSWWKGGGLIFHTITHPYAEFSLQFKLLKGLNFQNFFPGKHENLFVKREKHFLVAVNCETDEFFCGGRRGGGNYSLRIELSEGVIFLFTCFCRGCKFQSQDILENHRPGDVINDRSLINEHALPDFSTAA